MTFNEEMNTEENTNEELSTDESTVEEVKTEEEPVVEEVVVEEEPAVEEAVVEEEPAVEEAVVEEEPAVEEAVVEEEPAVEEAVAKEEPAAQEKKPSLNVDYLSADILNVREVTREDLIDNTEEEKFELEEDLIVNVKRNNIVTGNVVNVSDRDVFIDIGFKTEGIVPLSEFKNPPIIGKELEVVVEKFEDTKGNLVLSKEKADFIKRWADIRTSYEEEKFIKGTIIRRIKGGMVVDLDVIQAFLPGSQIDIKPVTDFDEYLGKEFEFKIVKLNEMRKNVVLSRKEILASDLQEKRKEVLEEMEEGMVLEGIVKNITDFGAFINLGGIDGLLHITDITWGRINHPSEKLEVGQTVQVKVIDFDLEKVRVSLGMKQLTKEPWGDIEDRYPEGSEVQGKVVNMMNYGLFIELEEGVEGLIHISEISWTKHIKHPSDVYNLGDSISAKVLSVEKTEKKISLGVKQLTSNPWDDIESNYKVGEIYKGVVKNLTQFGAFINLGDNIDGLLHVSDMSWTKIIKHPKEFLSVDDEVEVKILEVSSDDKKISLGIKQLEDNPWETLSDEYTSGKNIKGTVIKILEKGVIFSLDDNIEGILKTSNKDSYSIDQEYDLVVQGVDVENKKIIIMDDGNEVTASGASADSSEESSEDGNLEEEIAEENDSTSTEEDGTDDEKTDENEASEESSDEEK